MVQRKSNIEAIKEMNGTVIKNKTEFTNGLNSTYFSGFPEQVNQIHKFLAQTQGKDTNDDLSLTLGDLPYPSLHTFKSRDPVMDSSIAPFFALNNKLLCVPEIDRLDVYNVDNHLRIYTFSTSPKADVVAAGPLYHNPKQVYVAYSNRKIAVFDLSTKTTVLQWSFDFNLLDVKTTKAFPNRLFILCSSKNVTQVSVFEFENNDSKSKHSNKKMKMAGTNKQKVQNPILIGSLNCIQPSSFIIHPSIPNLGAIVELTQNKVKSCQIKLLDLLNFKSYSISDGLKVFKLIKEISDLPNFLAFHPTEPILSFSALNGVICQLRLHKSKNEGKYIYTNEPEQLHWHAMGLNGFTYTPDGLSLLSGGNEAVMVSWNLNNLQNSFIPRLRDIIYHLVCAPDQSLAAVRYQDGAISLIDLSTNTLKHTWSGPIVGNYDFPDCVEPIRNRLVFPGHSGKIDFYEYSRDKVVGSITTLNLNRVQSEDAPPAVTFVSFSHDGEWMAAATSIEPQLSRHESFLQFWKWERKESKYIMISEFLNPHNRPIICMKFYNGNLVSLSSDDTFKIWTLANVNTWECSFHSSKSNSPAKWLDISGDGSLLSITYQDKIALWDPNTLTLYQYLTAPSMNVHDNVLSDTSFIKAEFIPSTSFLAAITESSVAVFNLVAGQVWWSLPLIPSNQILVVDGAAKKFSITCLDTLLTFDPITPEPIYATHLPFHAVSALAVSYKQSDDLPSDLLLISKERKISKISARPGENPILDAPTKDYIVEEEEESLEWQLGMLQLHPNESKNPSEIASTYAHTSKLSSEFNLTMMMPAHLAPPVTQLAREFVVDMLSSLNIESNPSAPIKFSDEVMESNEIEIEEEAIEDEVLPFNLTSLNDEYRNLCKGDIATELFKGLFQ